LGLVVYSEKESNLDLVRTLKSLCDTEKTGSDPGEKEEEKGQETKQEPCEQTSWLTPTRTDGAPCEAVWIVLEIVEMVELPISLKTTTWNS
jgi:hypothetical protein